MKTDWFSCDGNGSLTRRQAMTAAGAVLAAWAGRESALANVTLHPDRHSDNVFVFVFLRGGADGLNMVVPYAEEAYYRARPSLGIVAPGKGKGSAIDLNGFFGLHPRLADLTELYHSGEMAILHACGSQDQTRSHFEAMSTVERGAANGLGSSSGWLARHLVSSESAQDSPLRAVAFADTMPDSFRGANRAIAMQSLAEFQLPEDLAYHQSLSALYRDGDSEAAASGRQTLRVLDALAKLDAAHYLPARGATYPASDLGQGLKQVACLVKGGLGLEVACLNKGGWDTHVGQGADTGWQASLLEDLGQSLAAFARDLGPELRRVTVVAMSEFGRRVQENSGLGTDHGRAGAAFVLGGGVNGGKVHGHWPGLTPSQLDEVGDLHVTTDYRDLLSEVLVKRLKNPHVDQVFPNFTPSPIGLFA